MKTLIENFSKQIREATQIGEKSTIRNPESEIRNIIVTGLGGSGIGGTILSEIVAGECSVPITVNKDYFLPAFVNENSLVIVSSYSGNTEETIQAMEAALKAKAKIVCVTSGGKVSEMAKQNKCDIITIPGGSPPRAALAYSLTQLFFILKKLQLVKTDFEKQLKTAADLIDAEEKNIREEAGAVAEFLFNKIPVIYAADGYNGVATRFRQQLNENSKMLGWHNILPEMNHNELVGWAGGSEDIAIVILRNKTDYSRTQARMEFSKKVFVQHTPHIKEIWSKGNSMIEQSIYLIHLTDWVSLFLAEKKGIDAVEVNTITQLKDTLAKS
ncbi:MAG: bifunctional phosphoglucose/phosphomannose isomerase [Bacteroidia bacterium]|nr:bifunctional phosphoglucose/phosphomannose isomerase [Bacteroidia bacterium]